MSQGSFVIYRSSAGSGKTYTLSKEYLTLALRGDFHFKHILAVTFTNKATQEMKSRIIEFLHDISLGGETGMAEEIAGRLEIDVEELRQRSGRVLSNILHGYTHFSVKTIDSFFQDVIRAFTKELGLQGGTQLELDQDKVLDDIVDRVIADVGQDKRLSKWLRQFAERKVEDGKGWDLRHTIREFGRELFKEEFKAIERDILEVTEDPEFIPSFLKKIYVISAEFEEKMAGFGRKALDVMRDLGLTLDDFPYKKSSFANYFQKLASKSEFKPGSRAISAADNIGKWATKSTPAGKRALIDQAYADMNDALTSAIRYYQDKGYIYHTAREVLRNVYAFGIMSDLAKKLREYRLENEVMLISDSSEFLNRIIEENDAPFIYEKVGTKFKNYLIDEFQDTSGYQWGNFKPLIQNSLSEGIMKDNGEIETNLSLLVGDVKQSIYRWRGGDADLLQHQVTQDIQEGETEIRNLDTNWRSCENVIAFNNAFFASAPQVLEEQAQQKQEDLEFQEVREYLNEQTKKISLAYEDVFQKFPEHKKNKPGEFGGYVRMDFVGKEENEDGEEMTPKEITLERIPSIIESLQEKGYAASDIAFLVRNAYQGTMITDRMIDYAKSEKAKEGVNYEVVSSESLYLRNASVVRILLHAFRALRDPKNRIAKNSLAYEYNTYILDKDAEADSLSDKEYADDTLPADFRFEQEFLLKLPLGELTETLARIFNLSAIKSENAYLQAFQDTVAEFADNQADDLSSFVEWWDEKGRKKSVKMSEDLDAMRVLTIHKSKGLQYKVVLVPFCDWDIDHNPHHQNVLWCPTNVQPFDEIRRLPINYGSKLGETVYATDYYREQVKSYTDNLNLLYVAFTRAEECLWLIAPDDAPTDKKGNLKIKGVHQLIRYVMDHPATAETIIDLGQYWQAPENRFELNNLEGINTKKKKEPAGTQSLNEYNSYDWRNRLEIARKSQDFFNKDFHGERSRINYGILLHDILSLVIRPEHVDSALDEYHQNGLIDSEERNFLRQKLVALVNHEKIKGWFAEDWTVKTEVPILPESGELARLDRVMLKDDEAVIVDYKTGFRKGQDIRQVRDYTKLLAQMGYKKIEGYLLYLEDMEVVKIV
ncbi:DNA helicase [Fulvitalea axinellae]|uniref:DNA 3'-5' helicase n=1 Tax=Fulvitalea axinellae TaxID=1182444 RepID=A0AAU9DC76_9BACT|nr:DNA helicase [Fulvitalea axinellae]